MIVSVVIPCRNEKLYIESCIEAIFQNEFSSDVNLFVTVVDGISDDGTIEIIEKIQQKYPQLKIVTNQKQLTPFAFNMGIKAIEADFYQIVGARQLISKNYIQGGIDKIIENAEIWCVGGKVENIFINKQSEIISKAMSTSFGMGIGNFRVINESAFVDTVGTPIYPRHVFEKVGYFDEDLVRNQDDEFNFRVTKAGGKILFDTEISLKYYVRASVKGLWRQFFQYGYWKVFVNNKHNAITTSRQLIPPVFVLYILLFSSTLLIHPILFFVSLVPLFLYFLLGIYFSLKLGTKINEIIQIFCIFPILHFSYGLGYLAGILDFNFLKKKPNEKQNRLSR